MRHAVGERCIVANTGRAVSGSAVNQKGLIMIIMAVQPTPGVFAVSGVRFSTSSLPSDGKHVRQRIAFQAAPPLRHSSSDKQRSRRASGAALGSSALLGQWPHCGRGGADGCVHCAFRGEALSGGHWWEAASRDGLLMVCAHRPAVADGPSRTRGRSRLERVCVRLGALRLLANCAREATSRKSRADGFRSVGFVRRTFMPVS